MATTTNLLELENISKSFDGVHALDDVSLTVGGNEIVGLLGDNGAGKSTLIKIVTGFHAPDRRHDHLEGAAARSPDRAACARARDRDRLPGAGARRPAVALAQHLHGPGADDAAGVLDLQTMRTETEKLMLEFLRFTSQAVTPETYVGSMSGGERQGVAIARALHFEAELIILDEPTMGLSLTETKKTLDFVREIKAAGKSCIFIDHNIFNVYEVADRVVVIDRGHMAGEFKTAEITVHELIERMQHVAETGSIESGGEAAP